ncbi:MAG: pentapeptide repeat-containing protein, partial [Pirellulaceae bacterium]
LNLDGATLVNADFSGVTFQNVKLEAVNIDGCDFRGLRSIGKLNLGGIQAGKAAFAGAKLVDSDWTGSILRTCDFAGADLSGARLAEIDWEDCDLRDVDLRGATFHMGSTRCGMVGSPYPSHGTRTGFYTDEYDEQYFQNPETIRKASLVGADLRGACLLGVDFYLVDLRGAKYDRIIHNHLVSTGAILDADAH